MVLKYLSFLRLCGTVTLLLSACLRPVQAANFEGETAAVFPLSVASGDPHAHGFLLMTHLSTEVFDADNPELTLEISEEEDFRKLVLAKALIVEPPRFLPVDAALQDRGEPFSLEQEQLYAADTSSEIPIKIYVDEPLLAANHYYYYRFSYKGVNSRVGRAHTLPERATSLASLRLGIVTCQDYTTGHYHAFDYLAKENLDFVVHLGDVIYEYDRYPGMPRRELRRPLSLPHGIAGLASELGVRKANSLADFRHIYRLERSDRHFQQALERHTWIFTRDDHEVADNVYWDYTQDEPGLPEHDPRRLWPKKDKNQLLLNALQAWNEYIPMHAGFNSAATRPQAALASFFKTYHFGTLADLFLIAGRMFRGLKTTAAPRGTMLGLEQKQWLLNEILESQSSWQLLGNQTLMAPFRVTGTHTWLLQRLQPMGSDGVLNPDAWDGFSEERQEILEALSNKSKVVVFTGDMHTSLASYLKRDFDVSTNSDKDNIIGAEFMTPSLTSPNFSSSIQAKIKIAGLTASVRAVFESHNPHFAHFHGGIYGYAIAHIQAERIDWFVYKIAKKSKKSKKLRKHLYYLPASKEIGKRNKRELKKLTEQNILSSASRR